MVGGGSSCFWGENAYSRIERCCDVNKQGSSLCRIIWDGGYDVQISYIGEGRKLEYEREGG